MGKGGTRYVADSVSARTGRTGGSYSNKDLKKNMEKYLESGVHPDVARAQADAAAGSNIPALPEYDANRPLVMLEVTIDGAVQGRLVIELFEDIAPIAASHFKSRCLPGGTIGLRGTPFHKLVPHFAAYGGRRPLGSEAARFPRSMSLRHIQPGLISVAVDGSGFALSLARALPLDTTHQVVGRVHTGQELLDKLNDVSTMPDDSPIPRIIISRCGPTNARGDFEELDGATPQETAAQATQRLQQESVDTRSAVLEALQVGMKRKTDEGGASTSGAAPGGGGASARGNAADGGGAAKSAPRSVRARVLDDLLGGLSEEESSGDAGD